jgi:hypothetical protein
MVFTTTRVAGRYNIATKVSILTDRESLCAFSVSLAIASVLVFVATVIRAITSLFWYIALFILKSISSFLYSSIWKNYIQEYNQPRRQDR